jgi:hypothetical protein
MEIDPVFEEFAAVLSTAATAHMMALSGIRRMQEYWVDRLAQAQPPTTPDSVVHFSSGDPRDPVGLNYSRWRLGDLPALLATGGVVMAQISQQWVVAVYTEWEEHYRARLTVEGGASEPLRLHAFGDLRHFRNDIVHHRGVATKNNTGRCEVFAHWFAPGDVLYFDDKKVAEFMAQLKLAEHLPADGWGDPERVGSSAVVRRVGPS